MQRLRMQLLLQGCKTPACKVIPLSSISTSTGLPQTDSYGSTTMVEQCKTVSTTSRLPSDCHWVTHNSRKVPNSEVVVLSLPETERFCSSSDLSHQSIHQLLAERRDSHNNASAAGNFRVPPACLSAHHILRGATEGGRKYTVAGAPLMRLPQKHFMQTLIQPLADDQAAQESLLLPLESETLSLPLQSDTDATADLKDLDEDSAASLHQDTGSAVEFIKGLFNSHPSVPPSNQEETRSRIPRHTSTGGFSASLGSGWWYLPAPILEKLQLPLQFVEEAKELYAGLGVPNVSTQLIVATLVHPSYYHATLVQKDNLEEDSTYGTVAFRMVRSKLELLGDSIISSVLTAYLVETAKSDLIGNVAKGLHDLRSNKSMSAVGLGPLQLASRILCTPNLNATSIVNGTERPEWHAPSKENVVANTLETVIGGIFLEKGIGFTSALILDKLLPMLQQQAQHPTGAPTGKLQELTVARANCLPEYRVHLPKKRSRTFTAEVFLKEQLLGTGQGPNKSSAKKEAAQNALVKLQEGLELPTQ